MSVDVFEAGNDGIKTLFIRDALNRCEFAGTMIVYQSHFQPYNTERISQLFMTLIELNGLQMIPRSVVRFNQVGRFNDNILNTGNTAHDFFQFKGQTWRFGNLGADDKSNDPVTHKYLDIGFDL